MEDLQRLLQRLFTEGATLLQAGNATGALERFQEAHVIAPLNAQLSLYSGAALHSLGRYEDAIASYRMAIAIAPDLGEAHNNLGNSLMALQRFTEAIDSFSHSIALLPSSPVPLTARATALLAAGRVDEGEADCRKALQLDSSFAAAHWNLALNLLLQGHYPEGWQEYEWRWRKPDFTSPLRHADIPLWDGSNLDGRTILLHAEQGFGDTIQFVRYAPMVAQRGGTVIIECHPQLVRILQSVTGVQRVIPFGSATPDVSCQAPLLSLPRIFGTTLQSIPSQRSYLSVTAEQRGEWAASVPPRQPETIKIGLVWAGKGYPDPLRSCRLEEFAVMSATRGISWYSLQLGPGSEQASTLPKDMKLFDLTDRLHDFADTAALIEQLDLVISIDTAVAHLAAALGKPVYLILPFAPDWRWLLNRNDSPWYPTMRIFRQNEPGDWRGVMSRVHDALDRLVQQQ